MALKKISISIMAGRWKTHTHTHGPTAYQCYYSWIDVHSDVSERPDEHLHRSLLSRSTGSLDSGTTIQSLVLVKTGLPSEGKAGRRSGHEH